MTCPSCGADASGRFCANCGAALDTTTCAACGAALTPGAKFCHRCGTPAGTGAPRAALGGQGQARGGMGAALPWAVAALALVVLIAYIGGQRFGAAGGSAIDGSRNALPQAGIDARQAPDEGAGAAPFANGAAPPGRAPDISQLTDEERADRLFDRLMRLASEGKVDSVQFFAPMALSAYGSLPSPTADQRYDYGRIGEVTGDAALARAEADTILRQHPAHLLGLILAARAATMRGDAAAHRTLLQRLVTAEPAERRKQLPEYERHRGDIDAALAEAKKGA